MFILNDSIKLSHSFSEVLAKPLLVPCMTWRKVRVEGFNYIGMGNSTNKKDAQSNAARDFVNYLVRVGEINSSEVPALGVSESYAVLCAGHV